MDGPPDYEREMREQMEAQKELKLATNSPAQYAFSCLENAIKSLGENKDLFTSLNSKMERPSDHFCAALSNEILKTGKTYNFDGFNKGNTLDEYMIKAYENKLSEWSCEWFKIFQTHNLAKEYSNVNAVKIQIDRHRHQRAYLLQIWEEWLLNERKKMTAAMSESSSEIRDLYATKIDKISSELLRIKNLVTELVLTDFSCFGLNDHEFMVSVK